MIYIVSILVTAILFLLLILLLAVKPEISKKITVGALAIAGGTGLLIYGYGYMVITKNFALAVLKALLAVCGSFVGRNEYANLSSIPFMNTIGMRFRSAHYMLRRARSLHPSAQKHSSGCGFGRRAAGSCT